MSRKILSKLNPFRRKDRGEQAALMSAISDPLLAVDIHNAPLFYNSKFNLLVDDKEIGKRRLWKVIVDHEVVQGYQAALSEGRSTSIKAVQFHTATGTMFFLVTISPLRRSNGKIYGALGVFHDVTELKQAEQMRIDFVANVSHELRTPLTSIKGYTDTLMEDFVAGRPMEEKFIHAIARNTSRLMNLVEDLLDLSSLEAGSVLQKIELETEDITNRIVRQLQSSSGGKKHTVVFQIDSSVVFADPRRLEQVLVNLLDNAFKYTPPGGQITIKWSAPNQDSVELRISDKGPGIPLEHQARLFERFYRVDKARSRESGGTGLGLAIVKHIMQRHGGSVWIESTPGGGATFVCQFPMK